MNYPALKGEVSKISPWKRCVCGGTHPPYPQQEAP